MRFLHSKIYIFIFDPNLDVIRAISIQCALCAKILRTFAVKQHNTYFGYEKSAVSWDYN
jgi:hypothetical protein